MKICRDGKDCHTWFGTDGSLICRHGLIAEGNNTTAVHYDKCPGDLFYEYEIEKWKQFYKDLPMIMERLLEKPKFIGDRENSDLKF